MSKSKKPSQETPKPASGSDYMKSYEKSKKLNNFVTDITFTKDLSIQLLSGTATPEHVEVLKKNIQGVKEFIEMIEQEIKDRKLK
jgi:hypothetical protein